MHPARLCGPGPAEGFEAQEMLGYKHSGFSVDTSVCIAAQDRAGLERLLRYAHGPRLRWIGCAKRAVSHLPLRQTAQRKPGRPARPTQGKARCSGRRTAPSRRSNSSTALPRWCRHRVRTATGTTACWRPIHPCGLRRLHWAQGEPQAQARARHSPSQAVCDRSSGCHGVATVGGPSRRAHPASSAQTPSSHSVGGADRPHLRGVAAVVPALRRARCASSLSSPTCRPPATSWSTSGWRQSRLASRQHAGRRCGMGAMCRWAMVSG